VLESRGVKILMYHWVSADPGQRLRDWGLTPDQFRSQMRFLHEQGYRTITLGEMVDVVRGFREVPEGVVALTFDDGYRDFLEDVAPVLEEYDFSATIFLVADRVGETNVWDARHGDPPRRLLSYPEALELASRGMELGSHSRTHRPLPDLSDQALREEIAGSKAILEDRLGLEVKHFSYPHGLFDDRCLELLKDSGYLSACADIRGGNGAGVDPFQLRRSLITCHETQWSFSFKLSTGFGMREWAASGLASLTRHATPVPLRGMS
jgi:peptidoglycan/xylan/chitin deacetylase (PgdA/CDA1 family)